MFEDGFDKSNLDVLVWFSFFFSCLSSFGDASYSVPEEMKRGSVIGNIAKDLGVDVTKSVFSQSPRRYWKVAVDVIVTLI